MVDVDTWLDFLDCMVLEEYQIYGLDVPCCLACTLMVLKNALVSLVSQLQIELNLCLVSYLPTLLGLPRSQHR